MATKTFDIEGIGEVVVNKSRRSKHLRLSINAEGKVKVSIPLWVSYSAGIEFAQSRRQWLTDQIPVNRVLANGDRIGKNHRIVFVPKSNQIPRTRVTDTEIYIYFSGQSTDDKVQNATKQACIRALKQEAEKLLVLRIKVLAEKHNFNYRSVTIRQLKGRWGSCNSRQEIALSCFLMQLSWDEIDYVLLHELTHTIHMSHSTSFWTALLGVCPKAKDIRKQIKQHKPVVVATN